jgi:hypothetical protein
MHTQTWFGNLTVRDLGTEGILILKMDLKAIRKGSVDWIHVAQYGNQRQVFANQRNFQLTEN